MNATTPAKPYLGLSMEGPFASWYAKNTGRDLTPHRRAAETIARQLPLGSEVLDLACGPGYLAVALAKLGVYRVTGLDISDSFMRIAAKNAAEAGVSVALHKGNASAMPFPGASFDALVCRAAFKNFSAPEKALSEMHRVLKPGGFAVIMDLDPKAPPEAVRAEVDAMPMSPINRALTRLIFKHMLLKRAHPASVLKTMAEASPFGRAEFRRNGISLEVWLRKPA
jgi:ubiquinone/menaquinone biosynthesis C-methylase UbiE